MSSLILPRRFTSQPNEFCRPSDQIRDAVALAPVIGLESLATQTVAGDLVKSASQNGIATTFASGQYVDVSHGYIGTDYTIVAVGDFTHAEGQRHVIDNDNFSSERVFQLRLVSYFLQFIPFDASGNPSTLTLTTDNFATTNSSAPRVIVARAGGGRVALNATHLGSTSTTVSSHRAMVGYTRIGNSVGATSYPNTDKTLAYAIIPRYLPDRLVDSIISDPWQLFHAKPRVLYFTAAGGGTNTDSAAGLGSIAVSGSAAAALRTHLGVAASGSISITGSAANAVRTFLAAAESGAISITGSYANGVYTPVGAVNSNAQSGAISVTGSAAIGRHDYLAAAGSGSITITGSSSSAVKSLGAVADSGSITINGSNALAIRTWLASADAGSITLTGSSANGVKATPGTGTLDPATIAAIADAVWSHSSAVQIEQRLTEAWGRLGLDPANPLISGQTEISFGAIVMALTGNETSSALTRQ